MKYSRDKDVKLVVKGKIDVDYVLDLIARDGDVVKLSECNKRAEHIFDCKCGEMVGSTDKYCSRCGRKLDKEGLC